MTEFEAFLEIFGDFTVLDIGTFLSAVIFLILIYKRIKDYFFQKKAKIDERAEAEKTRDSQIEEALRAVRQYPEYRKQSIAVQKELKAENAELRKMVGELSKRLIKMEEDTRRRECNKLRDRILQNYRYYTSLEENPSQSWTRMESDAFWALFREYEEAGGDGYMHTEVQPAMEKLAVIEHE